MTGVGTYILLINLVCQTLGFFGIAVDLLPEQVETLANAVSVIVGFGFTLVGQLRRKDLVGGIVRR